MILSAQQTVPKPSDRWWMIVLAAGVFALSGCIRDVPTEEKSSDGPRPKIAVEPEIDKLAAAVKAKNGDVIAGLEHLLGPFNPKINHPRVFLNSAGKIESLDLSGIAVTADGLKHLIALNDSLQRLSLNDVFIGDEAMDVLSGLPNLRTLELNRTPVTDAGMSHLATLTQLRELSLKGTKVTNEGVKHLSRLKQLRMLSLSWTHVTDDGLTALTDLPELNTLLLDDTQVTNAGLRPLRQFPKLQFLHLTGSKVTAPGVEAFRREKPGVHVTGP